MQYTLNDGNNRPGQRPFQGDNIPQDFKDSFREMGDEIEQLLPADVERAVITIAILAGCLILLLIVVGLILRYTSETALIRLVDQHEESGEKQSFRAGLRLGFSRTAWRLFLVDLVINLPLILFFVLYFVFVFAPLALWATNSTAAGIFGTIVTIGLFFLGLFLAIVVGALISLLKHFFRRAAALEGLGVIAAIRRGFTLVRQNTGNVLLMWLILIGVQIGFFLLIFPATFLTLFIAGTTSAIVGLSVGGLVGLISSEATAVIFGLSAGIPLFLLLMVIPLGFLGGLKETFISSTWTLTYRETRALESIQIEANEFEGLPEPDAPAES